jgi:hypothetical protein
MQAEFSRSRALKPKTLERAMGCSGFFRFVELWLCGKEG